MLAANNLTWISEEEADIIKSREKEPVSEPKVQSWAITYFFTDTNIVA